jgi:hypothetical protein
MKQRKGPGNCKVRLRSDVVEWNRSGVNEDGETTCKTREWNNKW